MPAMGAKQIPQRLIDYLVLGVDESDTSRRVGDDVTKLA